MNDDFFTSDEHYGHANILSFCKRPFENLEDMKEQLISRHNSKVGKTDRTFHLGDMFWRRVSIPDANEIMDRLNGKHYLVLGNHDEVAKRIAGRFEWVKDVHMFDRREVGVWLSHYAHRAWPASHNGSYHLFGHTHAVLSDYRLSHDAGVDANGYFPKSYEEVYTMMKSRVLQPDEVEINMLKNPWTKEV